MAGYAVGREYYVERCRQPDPAPSRPRSQPGCAGEHPPEDGYAGEYLIELAEKLRAAGVDDSDLAALGKRGVEAMLSGIEATLDRFGVRFDRFASEQALYDEGLVAAALDDLEHSGHSYRHDGAVWLRSTDFGDDKDRVLVRSDGETDLPRLRRRLPPPEVPARAGLGDPDRRLGSRPPRLHPSRQGRPRGARLRPRPLRGLDHAARPPRRGRRALADVEAGGRVRHARRAARRHRCRRGPLLHAAAQPRHDDRPRPRPGPAEDPGEPRLLRAVRPRADRQHPRQGGRESRTSASRR